MKGKKKSRRENVEVSRPPAPQEAIRQESVPGWVVPALVVCVVVTYWNSLHGSFQFDDFRLIRFNFSLRDITRWQDIFLSERYRPLLAWTFALNYRLTEQNPVSYHIFNLAFHALSVVLYFVFLRRRASSYIVPLAAAALMAVHPLNTESVTYIASRSTVLCSVFYFGALLCFDSYLRSSRKVFAAGYLLLFLLGATVKEEAAMIPILAFLYHVLFGEKGGVRGKLPVHLAAGGILAAGSVFRIWMQLKQVGPLPFPMSVWIPSQAGVWLRYLGLAVLPHGLNIDRDIAAIGFSSPMFWISAAVILAACALAWRSRMKSPFLAFWGLWFFLNLLPSSVFPLNDLMAEHRAYISTFGFAACAGYFLMEVLLPRVTAPSRVTILAMIVIVLGMLSAARNIAWATEVSLWSDSALKSPLKPRPRLNLAAAYMKSLDYDAAIREYNAVLQLNADVPLAYSGLGICYLQKEMPGPAEENFKKALALQPGLTDAQVGMGTVYYRRLDYPRALQFLEPAYQQRQESIPVVAMIADCNIRLKRFDRAIPMLRRGIELDPGTAAWYFRLMEACFLSAKYPEALQVYVQYGPLFLATNKYKLKVANMLLAMQRVDDGTKLLNELAQDPEYAAAAQQQLRALGKGR